MFTIERLPPGKERRKCKKCPAIRVDYLLRQRPGDERRGVSSQQACQQQPPSVIWSRRDSLGIPRTFHVQRRCFAAYSFGYNLNIVRRRGDKVPGSLLGASDVLIVVARVLLMGLFVITGWQKLSNFPGTVAYMAGIGAPVPTVSAAVSVGMELFVGIAIVLGIFTRPLALLFCAFTLGTALIGHRYWKLEGAERHENLLNFYKNLSIMGGLLLLAVTGPGRYALMAS